MRILLRGDCGGATFDFLFCKDILIYSRKVAFLDRFLNKLTGIVLLFYTSPPKKKTSATLSAITETRRRCTVVNLFC